MLCCITGSPRVWELLAWARYVFIQKSRCHCPDARAQMLAWLLLVCPTGNHRSPHAVLMTGDVFGMPYALFTWALGDLDEFESLREAVKARCSPSQETSNMTPASFTCNVAKD